MSDSTTILVFSRTAHTEQHYKKLHSNAKQNLKLHEALYSKTMAMVKSCNLPYIVVNEDAQQGKNFGDKFCNALEACFNNGVDNIIAIGTDCPTLNGKNILLAHKQLSKGDNVLGKDTHGGFYLLGLQKVDFVKETFANFNWCTNTLFAEVNIFLTVKNPFAVVSFCSHADVNFFTDILFLRHYNFKSKIIQLLLAITLIKYFFEIRKYIKQIAYWASISINGPPTTSLLCYSSK